jgi:hypothetical protein
LLGLGQLATTENEEERIEDANLYISKIFVDETLN